MKNTSAVCVFSAFEEPFFLILSAPMLTAHVTHRLPPSYRRFSWFWRLIHQRLVSCGIHNHQRHSAKFVSICSRIPRQPSSTKHRYRLSLCPISIWGKPWGPTDPYLLPPENPPPRSGRPNAQDLRRQRKTHCLSLPPRTGNYSANLIEIHPRHPPPMNPPKAS